VERGVNGLLRDFFDVDALSEAMLDAVRRPREFDPLRKAARRTIVERYDRKTHCLPAWMALAERVRAAP
jgi:glycosyltransferase involved in cell wall biosynthesis